MAIPVRTALDEDTYSYEFLSQPSWMPTSADINQYHKVVASTYQYNDDTFADIAYREQQLYPGFNPIGWSAEAWRKAFGYVRGANGSNVSSQLLELPPRCDIAALNPAFSSVDLIGVELASQPVQAAYTRIAYTLYGLNEYALAQHSAIVDECGGAGYFSTSGSGGSTMYRLDPVTYPIITPWMNPLPSRFRDLSSVPVAPGVIPPAMQAAWDLFWTRADGFAQDFGRGRIVKEDSSSARYTRAYGFQFTVSVPAGTTPPSTMTVRVTNTATEIVHDETWALIAT